MKKQEIFRGEIYLCDLGQTKGSEQSGERPVLIIQNDVGNRFSPTIIAVAITAQISKAKLPTHIELKAKEYNLARDSVILCEQVRTLDKSRLIRKVSELDSYMMKRVDSALMISLGMVG
ncbi:type II toxin-antitoxin system PemK/MazF family toxin [Robertmurraya siralis]|uniref:type II toxin-antitoxin system PemK/MazF family toxin n=1 Tax=Robertmurraya siralis TaxID=77777 RepID=UPI0010FA31C7|nr:type II toxin-antitoxin system PemK/MazF family toxin [Robertmurraya siralis]